MAYNALNNLIDAYIYANGVQAITGQILNGVLKQMVSQLGSGYHLMGVAVPATVPASNDYAMAYFAATAGEYTDFGGIILTAGEVAVLLTSGNGSWEKQTIYNVPTGTADLENTANFITNAVTDLVNYYTKAEVDTTLENYPTLSALATALADYYTKTEIDGQMGDVDTALADRYTKSETDTKLADYYRKTETYDKDEVDSIVATLSRQEYIVAWDGLAAPDVSAIPSGVTVTYSGTPYTGILAASASTVNKIYMVWNGVAYDMYATSQDGGYSWIPMGTTTVDLSQYATKDEVSQLEHKVFGVKFNFSGGFPGYYIDVNGIARPWAAGYISEYYPVTAGQKISCYCASDNDALVIAFYDSTKTFVNDGKVKGSGASSLVEYSSVAPVDGFVRFYTDKTRISTAWTDSYFILPSPVLHETDASRFANAQDLEDIKNNVLPKVSGWESISFDSAESQEYPFIVGHTYEVINTSGNTVTISTRETESGTSSNVLESPAHSSVEWEIVTAGVYFRCGGAASFLIIDKTDYIVSLERYGNGITSLIGIASSRTQYSPAKGERYFNLANNKICEAVDDNGSLYYIDPVIGSIYTAYGIAHSWDGVKITPIQTELKVVHLAAVGTSTIEGLSPGEFSYNTDNNILYYKISPTEVQQIPVSEDMIFVYNGVIYTPKDWGGISPVNGTYSGKIVPLYGIFGSTAGAISAGINNGQTYFNDGVKKLVTIIDKTIPSSSQSLPEYNVLYTVNNGLRTRNYFYNGDILIEEKNGFPISCEEVAATYIDEPNLDCDFVEDMPIPSSEIPVSINFGDRANFPTNLYSLYSGLISSYGNIITEHDAASEAGVSYPEGFAYPVKLYKIHSSGLVNPNKKKILIFAGEHGNEIAAQYNLYLFVKFLLEEKSKNYLSLKYNYDIWVIPILCVYGAINGQRVNENRVNINRNYPRYTFSVSGTGTADYTGPSAGSEIETQIIVGLVDNNIFDAVIDHHNYSGIRQFYSEIPYYDRGVLIRALYDVSFGIKKEYPSHFAGNENLFQALIWHGNEYDCISTFWFDDKGVPSCIAEISDTINFNGGTSVAGFDQFSAEVFSIGQYTLLRILVRLLSNK